MMEILLQNIASVLWIVLGACFFFGLRKWSKRFSELYEKMKEEIKGTPVARGRWIEKSAPTGKYFECSHCGAHENKHTAIKGHYCWRCGAKMDGGDNNGKCVD